MEYQDWRVSKLVSLQFSSSGSNIKTPLKHVSMFNTKIEFLLLMIKCLNL